MDGSVFKCGVKDADIVMSYLEDEPPVIYHYTEM